MINHATPVAYIHIPSFLLEGEVRPVVSFNKHQDEYDSGIYKERINLYTEHQVQDYLALINQMLAALQTCKYEYYWHKCFQYYDDKLVHDAIQSAEEILNKEKTCT